MASLVRQLKTTWVDANGKTVPAGTAGAQKVTQKLTKWYAQGIPGLPPKKRVPLATDKEAAKRMLRELVARAEQGHAGVPDPAESRKPLKEHLKAFENDVALGLASVKGRQRRAPNPEQVQLVVQRVRDTLAGCGLRYPSDLNESAPARLARYLTARTQKTRKDGGISAQSAAFMLAAVRRFMRWFAKKAPVRADLFDTIPGFDVANQRKHARREITPAELGRLLEAARASSKSIRTLSGNDRFHLYLTAFSTGLRAAELAALKPENFDLGGVSPMVSLSGRDTKNGKPVLMPLAGGVAAMMNDYLTAKPKGKPVWPGKWYIHAAKMLRHDLNVAGIAYATETVNGTAHADFHALRHSFVSSLAGSGASPKTLQALARHSDPRLSQAVYAHARTEDLTAAVSRLALPIVAVETNPLANLSRTELETLTVGLLGILNVILGPQT